MAGKTLISAERVISNFPLRRLLAARRSEKS
jgi:hypothetical protein